MSIKSKVKGFVDYAFGFRAKYLDSEDSKFFRDGFGDLDAVSALEAKIFQNGADGFEDIKLDKVELENYSTDKYKSYRATFISPAHEFMTDAAVKQAQAEILEPVGEELQGVVILLPMTGDEEYRYRRKNLAQPLTKAGFVTVSLIIPFYGKRRPQGAKSCYAKTFSEISITYVSAFLEAAKLVEWAEKAYPGVTVGICGMSQGGVITANASTYTSSDVVLVPVVAGLSMYDALRGGVLSASVSKRTIQSKQEIEQLDDLMKSQSCGRSISASEARGLRNGRKVTVRQITAKNDRFIPSSSSTKLANALKDYSTQFTLVTVGGGHVTTIKDAKTLVVPEIIRAFEEHNRA